MIKNGEIFADRYKIIKEIGRGGMANVYLASDTLLDDRLVAIKVLRSNLESDSIAVARFQREASAMAELNHPHIVGISDVGDYDDQQFIVMEYLPGETLKKYIKDNAPLSNEEAIKITKQVLSAMQLAHEKGIIHRDLKPQNILLDENGNAKVTDFGIAMAFAETSLTQTNSMFGSVHYLTPEQARGSKATVQSDIYAIGIILYEMLIGKVPFDGDSAVTIALQHFQKPIPSIVAVNRQVPQALENVVIKATAKNAQDRYPSTTDMIADLETSTSDGRAKEEKLVFVKDDDATKILPKNLVAPGTTEELVSKVSSDTPPPPTDGDDTDTDNDNDDNRKKKKAWTIAGIVGALIAILTLLVIFTTPKDVKVPNLSGMTASAAESRLKKDDLKVGKTTKELNSSVPKGKVIRTNPTSGTYKKSGAKIDLYISLGANVFEMSNYKGQTYQDAVDDLVNKYGVDKSKIKKKEVKDSSYANGEVVGQTPKSGKYYDKDSDDTITLKVSTGSDTSKMPNFSSNNTSLADAISTLKSLGVPEKNITTEVYDDGGYYDVDTVTKQSIKAGKKFNTKKDKIVLGYTKARQIVVTSTPVVESYETPVEESTVDDYVDDSVAESSPATSNNTKNNNNNNITPSVEPSEEPSDTPASDTPIVSEEPVESVAPSNETPAPAGSQEAGNADKAADNA